ncbi:MAG: AmmeMemoRadiSam system radical SAM enzyme [Sporomusaceae bacterium]|nr:AmmeMemoRadiSam system radical SAM enzyme [Sporomusaceae bacterium]
MREAMYYQPYEKGVLCSLCPKGCTIAEGGTGFCRVRKNVGNKLYTENYAACSSYALDPIEKKPLYHFYPGSLILSLGTWGCNFSCSFCQNWQIAQESPSTTELLPEEAVKAAQQYANKGNIGIAYTYSEPSVWYEYVLDTAKLAKQAGLKNVLVTNGFINTKPLEELLPYIDAMNIDVKAFNNEYYRKVCAGSLEHVKQTVEQAAKACHVEITTLLVPGLNDDQTEITGLAQWLSGVNPNIPLHFSRYFPNYKMKEPPTPESTMEMAYKIASQYLNYVYLGNMNREGGNTFCPKCSGLVIDRSRSHNYLDKNHNCPKCGHTISISGEISL